MKSKIKWFFFAIFFNRTFAAQMIGVKIGKGCRVYTYKFGTEPWLISIGDNCTITNDVIFLTHDGSTCLCRDEKGRRYLYKRIIIGNNVFIGVNSIILPGVIIEDNCIVAAGSVVTKSIRSGSIVGGNPAKLIGSFCDYHEKVITSYPSIETFKGKRFKDRVMSVLSMRYKDFLK